MADSPKPVKFPLVGIGASAGGLDSFEKFLKAVPVNSGMACIIVQHLSPTHESILPEILSRATTIPVNEITDDCVIEADHIYVIPENRMLEVTDLSLKLTPREPGNANMPIDVFFSSLARVHGPLAVGVILSGTAHDGTAGLGDIKEHGGITFAEDPGSAAWDGMPKSAIAAGVVDFVLPAAEIPSKLINVHAVYQDGALWDTGTTSQVDESRINRILAVVQQQNGVDFSNYKKPTMLRRIDRRMAINQIGDHRDYLGLLVRDRTEQESLFQDLLIKVTSFFRDPEVFEELGKTVLPRLLENGDETIRIWVCACATGEEAYSLAIALFDAMGGPDELDDQQRKRIQIFATDISEGAINRGRSGVYSPGEVQPLSQERLDTYFTKTNGSYKVIKSVRDTIVFAHHNFLQDPPFGNLDLISCRNVMIYLDPVVQKNILSTFQYALRENGFLLLGKSETPGTDSDRFVPFSKQGKIYTRKAGRGRLAEVSPGHKIPGVTPLRKQTIPPRRGRTDFRKSAENVLISHYTPVSLIVDERMDIVQINGNAAAFLGPWSGRPTRELMKMARKELAFELRNALHKARESQRKVVKEGIPLKHEGEQFLATIEIVPLTDTLDPHYLVLFRKDPRNTPFLAKIRRNLASAFAPSEQSHRGSGVAALERELAQSREDMRSISDEQEAYGEELQSSNEELLSSNEEMRSLNEELETSKEEVQSTNEELVITNRELTEKREEQDRTLELMDAVHATHREPFVVLEKDLRVQMANAAYYKKFDTDKSKTEGWPFLEIQDGLWDNKELRSLLKKVLPKKQRIMDEEIVIRHPSGKQCSFMFNAKEIVREKESHRLILLSMEDITEKKKTQDYLDTIAELKKTNEQLDRYVHVASHDLQEPLRKIMVFSDRLIGNGEPLPAGKKEMLNKIASSAERMSGLIKGLLEYSRLANHGDLFEPTDLNGIMTDILSDFELLIEQKNARMDIGALPVLEAIPVQIFQLMTNLIGNALKFSSEGVAPIVVVSSRPFPEEDIKKHPSLKAGTRYQEIIVKDNGIGFDQRYGEHIFIIFQRLRESRGHKGTGMGLSLVKRITENHNGAVHAVSGKGGGATFHVILPIEQAE